VLSRPDAKGHYLRELLDKPFTDEPARRRHCGAVAAARRGRGRVGQDDGDGARVVHVVAFHGVAPSSVLGLTFTNKGCGTALVVGAQTRCVGCVCTISSTTRLPSPPTTLTLRAIVRDHALRIGREPMTTFAHRSRSMAAAMRVVRQAPGPFTHMTWQPAYMATSLLALDAEMAEHLVTPR